MRAQMQRVLTATVIAVASTLVCCLNPVFAADSIINGHGKLRGTLLACASASPDDSPGLELSDGAVLS